ncbi:hypothetical protein [Leptospira santarosai]|uniref:hypothetical protein n=1 Tax=Leptospira santarosai TaxID=28183 RepID=UPI0024AEFAF7|nr:hypothetical protein [Leptospira santarosai]MDI7209080.1 hypothetical protein [Leptospira santarosai]MDI7226218.1 hypothetical protein [Leptospira santarosai]
MKVSKLAVKRRKKNASLLRRGTDLTLNEDYIHLRAGSLWVASWAWPTRCFPITLQGAKQFLRDGREVLL